MAQPTAAVTLQSPSKAHHVGMQKKEPYLQYGEGPQLGTRFMPCTRWRKKGQQLLQISTVLLYRSMMTKAEKQVLLLLLCVPLLRTARDTEEVEKCAKEVGSAFSPTSKMKRWVRMHDRCREQKGDVWKFVFKRETNCGWR